MGIIFGIFVAIWAVIFYEVKHSDVYDKDGNILKK